MIKDNHEITSDDDTIELYPAKKIKEYYRNNEPKEKLVKEVSQELKNDDAINLLPLLADKFYEKWDKEGVSDEPIEFRAGDLMDVIESFDKEEK